MAQRNGNYKADMRKKAFLELVDVCDLVDYSLGDILYSILRSFARAKGVSAAYIRDISDEELYKAIVDFRETEVDEADDEESVIQKHPRQRVIFQEKIKFNIDKNGRF